ncbi:MAG: hypothetical protein ACM31E_05850, partial [Fibrobacterota bacterium]
TDTVYYTAFRDTDGQHVLLYYANYSYKSCFQIFKEGLGLVYECVHNSDGDGKNTLLSKVDGVSIDITSLLSRITGMIYAFTDLCQQSATVITISRSDFDSVQVYEHKKYKLLFNIQSDTTFTVAHENLWDLNLWSNGKGQSIFIPSYDTIAVTGITYKSVGKIPYHDYFW